MDFAKNTGGDDTQAPEKDGREGCPSQGRDGCGQIMVVGVRPAERAKMCFARDRDLIQAISPGGIDEPLERGGAVGRFPDASPNVCIFRAGR